MIKPLICYAAALLITAITISGTNAQAIQQPATAGESKLAESKTNTRSLALYKFPTISKYIEDVPLNDSCEAASLIIPPYPVSGSGTTIDATIDCPTLLFWQGVWYAIYLPYTYNDIYIDICGSTEDLLDAGIILMNDCSCDDMIGASDFEFLEQSQCSTGFTGLHLEFNSIPQTLNDDSLVYWPVYAINSEALPMDFVYTINVTEGSPPPLGDICDDPIIITSLPFSDSLNSCDFNHNYNFGGEDVIYQLTLDDCAIVDISLCQTSPIFDSYLLLYEATSCGQSPRSTDDDACMQPGEYGVSRIIDTLETGVYYIAVDAYSGECGEYILEVTSSPCPIRGACCIETACIGTITSDSCALVGGDFYANEDCDAGYLCPGSCYEYLRGDINMAIGTWPPAVIGSDVTYLVNYFRGLETSRDCKLDGFWCSADANGDCRVVGSDVTLLVNYFRGIIDLSNCPDCPPCWLAPADLPEAAPAGWPDCDLPE